MNSGNLIGYTIIYSYRCSCNASNRGTLEVRAQTEYAALQLAYGKLMACSSCGSVSVRKDLKAHVQMLSF